MFSFRKFFISGFLIVGLLIAGFIFLLKGCLAKYNERTVMAPAMYFEKDGNSILFSIVKFEKATSYSSTGGFVRKTVTTTYHIQTNEANNGKRLKSEKLKSHEDVRFHPVESIGAANGNAWIFLGELMAFDPFTLTRIADKKMIEEKNPFLKNKMPDERNFYAFNEADSNIYFTSTDGVKWKLDTKSLLVKEGQFDPEKTAIKAAMERVKQEQEKNQEEQTALNKTFQPTNAFFHSRDVLQKKRDSLQQLYSTLQQKETSERHLRSSIDNFKRHSTSFSQININQDTIGSNWYGMYSREEMEKLYERVQLQSAYDLTARRLFVTTGISPIKYGGYLIEKKNSQYPSPEKFFLQAGFLVDKQTALPIHLKNPGGFLVVSKDKIGNESMIIVSRVHTDGREAWQANTGLKEWLDWIYTGDKLILLGASNKEVSGNDANQLLIVNLANGSMASYDFFTDKE